MKPTIAIFAFFLLYAGTLQAQLEDALDDLTESIVDLAVAIDDASFPNLRTIEQTYQDIRYCQANDDYTLLVGYPEVAYQQARERYLKRKNQQEAVQDKILYIDRFYGHTLPNKLVPDLLMQLQRILEIAPLMEKTAPQELIELLEPYRAQLNTYAQLGARVNEVAAALRTIDDLQNKLAAYQNTEAYTNHLIDQRTIAAAVLQEPQAEASIRTALQTRENGTVYLVHLRDQWMPYQDPKTSELYLTNYGQATLQAQDGSCYLVFFDVKKPDQPANATPQIEVTPYRYEPMRYEHLTTMPNPSNE